MARARAPRPHPYAGEASGGRELQVDPQRVAVVVLGTALALAVLGVWLQTQYGYYTNRLSHHHEWELWTRIPLFAGLGLLGLGLFGAGTRSKQALLGIAAAAGGLAAAQLAVTVAARYAPFSVPAALQAETLVTLPLAATGALAWALMRNPGLRHEYSMGGWVLFGAYWALTARDLLVREGQDYVNFVFALAGVFLCLYLAYHVWLDRERQTRDDAVRFLQVSVFVAAGSYFLIDKVQVLREWLITTVAAQTKWGLDLFGQGDSKGLVFEHQAEISSGPTRFYYPDTSMTCPDGTSAANVPHGELDAFSNACPTGASNWFEELLFTAPGNEGLLIVPVNIILACTALQSIMLFVGLFAGTRADWRKILKWSIVVGGLVYVLNLVRNVGIIWFYGQGHASFWMMHNAIGKGGSLVAILLIALALFRWFPEFFRALVGVLDLVDRDGPLERSLKIGRRRPQPETGAASGDAVPGTA